MQTVRWKATADRTRDTGSPLTSIFSVKKKREKNKRVAATTSQSVRNTAESLSAKAGFGVCPFNSAKTPSFVLAIGTVAASVRFVM